MIRNVYWPSCEIIAVRFDWNLNFLDRFSEMSINIKLHENPSGRNRVVADGYHYVTNSRLSQFGWKRLKKRTLYLQTMSVGGLPLAAKRCVIFSWRFVQSYPAAYRGCRVGVFNPLPPPKLQKSSKTVPNSTRLWKLSKIAEFKKPTSQYVRKKCSKILKLPSFAIVWHWQWQINWLSSQIFLKYQKLRKFYYMKWNFLYQITAASRTSEYGATAPRSPFSLSSVLNWICWTPPK